MADDTRADIISRRVRDLLADHLTSVSTLREIATEFDAEDIDRNPAGELTTGQRRSLINQYYTSLNFGDPIDCRKFLNVLTYRLQRLFDSTKCMIRPLVTQQVTTMLRH